MDRADVFWPLPPSKKTGFARIDRTAEQILNSNQII